jgi:hypothetical protein
MTKQRNSPGITLRAIVCDGRLVGCIGSFAFQRQTEVTCWIGLRRHIRVPARVRREAVRAG